MNRQLSIHICLLSENRLCVQINIKISDCCALAPGLSTNEDWMTWAKSGQCDQQALPAFDLVPSRMKRRMSLSSKLVIQVSLLLSSRHDIDYGVFISRHGELPRTLKLLNEILSGEEASPIAFSQSVHNTASGLFTIADKNPLPVTSLAACQDSFQQGVIEAFSRLNTSVKQKILLVCFDEVVPEVYNSFADELSSCYALGLVLESGDGWVVETCDLEKVSKEIALPQALQFAQSYFLGRKNFIIAGSRQNWEWKWVN
jgi:hypothetical protein